VHSKRNNITIKKKKKKKNQTKKPKKTPKDKCIEKLEKIPFKFKYGLAKKDFDAILERVFKHAYECG